MKLREHFFDALWPWAYSTPGRTMLLSQVRAVRYFQAKYCGTLWLLSSSATGLFKEKSERSGPFEHPTHLLLKSQVRAKGMFSEHSCLVSSETLRVFETSADTVARNHVAGKVRGGRAFV